MLKKLTDSKNFNLKIYLSKWNNNSLKKKGGIRNQIKALFIN